MPDSPHYPATVCLVLLCLLFTGCDDSERRELENKLSSRREQHRERENELTEERDRALKRVRNLEEENDELQERVEDELSRVEEAEENTDTLKDEKVELEEELSQVNEDLKACRKKRAQEEKQALNNIDPDGLISTLEGAGARFSAEGDYQAAVDVLDVLTDIAPDDPLALYRLAYAHQRLDNHEEAADLYNETINVLEKSDGNTRLRLLPSACNNYGSVLVQMGEYDDAQD
ncbi:MAG: tetratricopeptide repeat protein, partial [Planctomycetota bacterium]